VTSADAGLFRAIRGTPSPEETVLRDPLPDAESTTLLRRLVPGADVSLTFSEVLVRSAGVEQLGEVRASVGSWLEDCGVPMDRYATELAAHELAANALLHGDGTVDLLIVATAKVGVIAVHDGSPVIPTSAEAEYHGLWILSRLTHGGLSVIPVDDNGKWVVAVLPTTSVNGASSGFLEH
jgi:hypothetical protein